MEKQDSGDSAKVATLHWKEEGKTVQAVSSTVRSVCRAPEQVAKAPKAASAIIIKATGTKAERRAPPGKGYSGNKINRGSLSCYSGYCW